MQIKACNAPFITLSSGLSPYSAPGAFSLLAATELTDGVWYPLGGFGTVRDGLKRIAEKLGVRIRIMARVAAIETSAAPPPPPSSSTSSTSSTSDGDGESSSMHASSRSDAEATGSGHPPYNVVGVVLDGGERIPADIVVSNR